MRRVENGGYREWLWEFISSGSRPSFLATVLVILYYGYVQQCLHMIPVPVSRLRETTGLN